jgi:IclR family transcriptional regulator, acetate operon repressor
MQGMCSAERNGLPVTVVGRAALLLDCLAAGDSPGISELARRSGLAKTTVFRLVHELASCGLVEATGDGVRLGMRLFELGSSVPRQRSLREAALPYMRDLHEATGETVHLAVLDGAEVVYIAIRHGTYAPRLPSRVGGRMPAHATGVGKAILAFSPPDVVPALIAAGLERRTGRTIVAPGALGRELARIRESGIAFDREESGPGIVCAASPVFGAGGTVVAALSLTGWSARLKLDRVAPAVRTAALALSRQLGTPAAARAFHDRGQ